MILAIRFHEPLADGPYPNGSIRSAMQLVQRELARGYIECHIDIESPPCPETFSSLEVYHAAALLYSWMEYCWDDLDHDQTQRFFNDKTPVKEYVDFCARKYDIHAVDAYTQKFRRINKSITLNY